MKIFFLTILSLISCNFHQETGILPELLMMKQVNQIARSDTSESTSFSVTYPEPNPHIYFAGDSISMKPTFTGTISSCSISPSLPSGLSISESDCSITGSSSSGVLGASYIVTTTFSNNYISTTSVILKIQSTIPLRVYGQFGSFTCGVSNNNGSCVSGTPNANSLNRPQGLATDSQGNLYVADFNNHRVLFFPAGSTTATKVYGQLGSFTANTNNNGGITSNSLSSIAGVIVDNNGNLYIADSGNHRILFYPSGSTTATRVYGQLGSFTSNTSNNGGRSANSLNNPQRLALDSNNNLYVTEYDNHRALFYLSESTTATRVYGQLGSFTSGTSNNGGRSANSLRYPTGVQLDSNSNLYIADTWNSRVLYFLAGSTTATNVYGQLGNFTTGTPDQGGISANSLNGATAVLIDPTGNLYIGEYDGHRILYFPSGSTTATRVFGQFGSFTCRASNNNGSCSTGTTSTNNFNFIQGLCFDFYGNLYAADYSNNRVLLF